MLRAKRKGTRAKLAYNATLGATTTMRMRMVLLVSMSPSTFCGCIRFADSACLFSTVERSFPVETLILIHAWLRISSYW